MTKIKYCSPEFLTAYKANFETEYLALYLTADKEAIKAIFDPELIFTGDLEFNYTPLFQQKDFTIRAHYTKENSKLMYTMLKELTKVQATKEELWFTLIHTVFLDYLLEYIKDNQDDVNLVQKIRSAIFFTHGNMRSLVVQHLAKYWWIGYRTYDETNSSDPFWLTDFYTEIDPLGKAISFFSSKITNNQEITLGIIEAVKEATEQALVRNTKETYMFINEYFNFIGGVRILDIMSRAEVKKETLDLIESLIQGEIEMPLSKKKAILGATSNYL